MGQHTLNTELFDAVDDEDLARVAHCLRNGANVNATQEEDAASPLMAATRKGTLAIVETLLANGADVLYLDSEGNDVLTCASDREIVDVLLRAGADANAVTTGEYSSLVRAIFRGDDDVVETLLKAGDNVHYTTENGTAPLMYASMCGLPSLVERLLQAGAHVCQINSNGGTALTTASAEGHADVVKLLLSAGADVRHADKSGRVREEEGLSPLQLAAFERHDSVVAILVEAGAQLELDDAVGGMTPLIGGMTPLMHASFRGRPSVVVKLLDAGADVNATGAEGATALTKVAYSHYVPQCSLADKLKVIDLLLLAHADIDHPDAPC